MAAAAADNAVASGSGTSGNNNAIGSCPITLHIPTSALQFGPDIVGSLDDAAAQSLMQAQPHLFAHQQQQIVEQTSEQTLQPPSQRQAARRPHPGGLETLPEASHVNALANATGPSPPGLQAYIHGANGNGASSSGSIEAIVASALAALSPPSRSRAVTRAKGYAGIVVDIANERWRERWSRLCLASDEAAQQSHESVSHLGLNINGNGITSASPSVGTSAKHAEWELYAQASGAGGLGISPDGSTTGKLSRSSSRKGLLASPEKTKHDKSASPQRGSSPLKGISEESRNGSMGGSVHNSYGASLSQLHVQADRWRRAPCFNPGEVNIARFEDSGGVTAVASSWLELDSPDEGIRLDSELALRQEVSYAAHLGITSMILPPPSSDPECRPYLVDYARAIAGCFSSRGSEAPAAGHFMYLAIRLPISSPYKAAHLAQKTGQPRPNGVAESSANATQTRTDDDWSWQVWHVVENICGYNARLGVALDLSAPLPPVAILDRWNAEPVSHIWLPARSFLANAKGYPVLSKANQTFLRSLVSTKAPYLSFVIVGSQKPPSNHARGGQAAYEQYIRHIERAVCNAMTQEDIQSRAYADYLQAPLQPLFDNLEAQTYATFEADAIKYEKYEEAVYQALRTLPRSAQTVIWVCGAGRGPLVSRCIEAGRRAARTIRVVALEKNANAIVGLRNRAVSEWGTDVVSVELGDMRSIAPPREKADIIVSELLGSFGDNELSPECLDGAMRILKPNGICIPQAYTAYITPISTPKLWSEVRTGVPVSTGSETSLAPGDRATKAAETPYVVLLKAVTYLANAPGRDDTADLQSCWTFDHSGPAQAATGDNGLPLSNSHNGRTATLTFRVARQSVCHGLGGFFEAHLFGDVVLSILPDPARHTPSMMSWFPMYFPFKEPLFLPARSEIDVTMWRLTAHDRVWYEWSAQSFITTMVPDDLHTGASNGHMDRQRSGSLLAAPPTPTLDPFLNPLPGGAGNSPGTPRISLSSDGNASSALLGADDLSSAPSAGASSIGRRKRELIGLTALMNPGGRSSCVRL